MARLLPTNIQLIGDELAIAWNDGAESFFSLAALRMACPCAVCGGEPDVLGNVVRPEVYHSRDSYALRGWSVVGGYAIQPAWADGHGSGLYSFAYLKKLEAAAVTSAAQDSPNPTYSVT